MLEQGPGGLQREAGRGVCRVKVEDHQSLCTASSKTLRTDHGVWAKLTFTSEERAVSFGKEKRREGEIEEKEGKEGEKKMVNHRLRQCRTILRAHLMSPPTVLQGCFLSEQNRSRSGHG